MPGAAQTHRSREPERACLVLVVAAPPAPLFASGITCDTGRAAPIEARSRPMPAPANLLLFLSDNHIGRSPAATAIPWRPRPISTASRQAACALPTPTRRAPCAVRRARDRDWPLPASDRLLRQCDRLRRQRAELDAAARAGPPCRRDRRADRPRVATPASSTTSGRIRPARAPLRAARQHFDAVTATSGTSPSASRVLSADSMLRWLARKVELYRTLMSRRRSAPRGRSRRTRS